MDKNAEEMDKFLARVRRDWPQLVFKIGRKFSFRAPAQVMIEHRNYQAAGWDNNIYKLQVLHEVAHAALKHEDFATDLARLKMERAAWERARDFCAKYGVEYDEEYVEAALDTYRDWLHRRARCPKCGLTRYQAADGAYHCPACEN